MTNDRTTKWRDFERIGHWYFGFGICLVLGAWCLVIPAGCSSGGKTQPRVPVSGIVTLDGKPLSKAVVSLVPKGETAGDGGIATTDASGQFEVTSRDTKSRGCPIGSYTVMISKWANPDGSDFTPTRDVAPMDSGAERHCSRSLQRPQQKPAHRRSARRGHEDAGIQTQLEAEIESKKHHLARISPRCLHRASGAARRKRRGEIYETVAIWYLVLRFLEFSL